MKKLSKKTITGLVLASGLVVVGVFIAVANSHKPVDYPTEYYASKASNKETLNYAEKEVEKAEAKVETANKEVEKAEKEVAKADENLKSAENKVTEAKKEEEDAEKQLEKAKAELESATTKEAKAAAQNKVIQATKAKDAAHNKLEEANKALEEAAEKKKAAEEAQRKAEQVAKEAEDARLKAIEEANRLKQEAEVREVAETTKKVVETTTTTTTQKKTTNSQENKAPEEKNSAAVNLIINAAKKTQNATSLTVYDITNKWAKKYNKSTGNELITYYSGSAASNGRSGVLYSYTSSSNAKTSQKSLFKPMETSIWNIPNVSSIKGDAKTWEMQFSGKRTVGVPELELLKKEITDAKLYSTAASLVTKSANVLLQNVSYYKVTIDESDVIEWLAKYYNTNNATALNNDSVKSVDVIVGISNAYVTYISNVNNNNLKGFEIMTGENGKFTSGKYLKFEVVLTNANNTSVPTLADVGLDNNSVEKLEEEYKAHYGCKKEWTSSEKYGTYYYWVCKP